MFIICIYIYSLNWVHFLLFTDFQTITYWSNHRWPSSIFSTMVLRAVLLFEVYLVKSAHKITCPLYLCRWIIPSTLYVYVWRSQHKIRPITVSMRVLTLCIFCVSVSYDVKFRISAPEDFSCCWSSSCNFFIGHKSLRWYCQFLVHYWDNSSVMFGSIGFTFATIAAHCATDAQHSPMANTRNSSKVE